MKRMFGGHKTMTNFPIIPPPPQQMKITYQVTQIETLLNHSLCSY